MTKESLSPSEKSGIAYLDEKDLKIYSVGISTAGSAEIKMALLNLNRNIIATTIDPKGATSVQNKIKKMGLEKQIQVKIEDVSKKLPYPDEMFDFVYARLVLHYLKDADLKSALHELCRVLKPKGKFFVVMRSEKTPEANLKNNHFDPITHLTTFHLDDKIYARNFQSEESLKKHLQSAGFTITAMQSYEEQLFVDFERTHPSKYIDVLIEVLATKAI